MLTGNVVSSTFGFATSKAPLIVWNKIGIEKCFKKKRKKRDRFRPSK